MNLLKVLIISLSAGVGLSYFKNADIMYSYKCLIMSVIYFLLPVFCYRYVLYELKSSNKLEFYLISALCICMIISSWFNYLFINPDMYYALIDVRRNNLLSWNNIYKTIELICLLIVGRNGFAYLCDWVICRARWISAIITNNTAYYIGR